MPFLQLFRQKGFKTFLHVFQILLFSCSVYYASIRVILSLSFSIHPLNWIWYDCTLVPQSIFFFITIPLYLSLLYIQYVPTLQSTHYYHGQLKNFDDWNRIKIPAVINMLLFVTFILSNIIYVKKCNVNVNNTCNII